MVTPKLLFSLCRFEHVALEYDEDEIGDLSDQEEDMGGDIDQAELHAQLQSLLTIDQQDRAASIMRMVGPGGCACCVGWESLTFR